VFVTFSKHGHYRVSATNEDAKTVLRVVDTTTNHDVALPVLPNADITGTVFSRDETKMGFLLTSDRTPQDLWMVDVAGGAPRQLTHALNAAVDPNDLVDSQVVRFPSSDGLAIPAILYRPKDASAAHKVPRSCTSTRTGRPVAPRVLGATSTWSTTAMPSSRSTTAARRLWQDVLHMDDKKHGDADLKDVVARGRTSPGSTGSTARTSRSWRQLRRLHGRRRARLRARRVRRRIDIFGVMNWVRTLESIPAWWPRSASRCMPRWVIRRPTRRGSRRSRRCSTPTRSSGRYSWCRARTIRACSSRVRRDRRRGQEQRRAGRVPRVRGRGHGFQKQKNTIAAQEAYLKFLDHYLRGR